MAKLETFTPTINYGTGVTGRTALNRGSEAETRFLLK
jgi:hypothetical protein